MESAAKRGIRCVSAMSAPAAAAQGSHPSDAYSKKVLEKTLKLMERLPTEFTEVETMAYGKFHFFCATAKHFAQPFVDKVTIVVAHLLKWDVGAGNPFPQLWECGTCVEIEGVPMRILYFARNMVTGNEAYVILHRLNSDLPSGGLPAALRQLGTTQLVACDVEAFVKTAKDVDDRDVPPPPDGDRDAALLAFFKPAAAETPEYKAVEEKPVKQEGTKKKAKAAPKGPKKAAAKKAAAPTEEEDDNDAPTSDTTTYTFRHQQAIQEHEHALLGKFAEVERKISGTEGELAATKKKLSAVAERLEALLYPHHKGGAKKAKGGGFAGLPPGPYPWVPPGYLPYAPPAPYPYAMPPAAAAAPTGGTPPAGAPAGYPQMGQMYPGGAPGAPHA